jgi:hypothetical protein
MQSKLKGILIHTEHFGWQVRYEFGQNQSKCLTIHHESIKYVKENGIEGEEVEFEIKATPVPNTLNGAVSSARIIVNN